MHILPFSVYTYLQSTSIGKIRQRRRIYEIPFQPGPLGIKWTGPFYLSGKSDAGHTETRCELEKCLRGF